MMSVVCVYIDMLPCVAFVQCRHAMLLQCALYRCQVTVRSLCAVSAKKRSRGELNPGRPRDMTRRYRLRYSGIILKVIDIRPRPDRTQRKTIHIFKDIILNILPSNIV